MTVILGLIDKKLNKAYMACDGVTQCGNSIINRDSKKIIKFRDDLYIGFSGNKIVRDMMTYHSNNLLEDLTEDKFAFQIRKNILKVFETEKYKSNNANEYEVGAVIIFGKKLYRMTREICLTEITSNYKDRHRICSCGLGHDWIASYMLGVINTNPNKVNTKTISEGILHCGEHYPEMGVCYLDDVTCFEVDI